MSVQNKIVPEKSMLEIVSNHEKFKEATKKNFSILREQMQGVMEINEKYRKENQTLRSEKKMLVIENKRLQNWEEISVRRITSLQGKVNTSEIVVKKLNRANKEFSIQNASLKKANEALEKDLAEKYPGFFKTIRIAFKNLFKKKSSMTPDKPLGMEEIIANAFNGITPTTRMNDDLMKKVSEEELLSMKESIERQSLSIL